MMGRLPDPRRYPDPSSGYAMHEDAVQMVRIREEMHGCESVRIEKRISIETGLPVYRATFQLSPHEVHIPREVLDRNMATWMGNGALIAELKYLKETLLMSMRLAVDAAVQRLWDRRNETGGEGR